MYQSSTFWYATFLTQMKHPTLPYLLLLNAGGVIGSGWFGWLSEKWGRRPSATLGVVAGMASAFLFLFSSSTTGLLIGAALFGFTSIGGWGMVPGYLAERFPTEARGVGTGFTYHVGVGIAATSPYIIGAMQDAGTSLATAMLWCILGGGTCIVLFLWLGPETKGTNLESS
jgi:MFS family permease